MVTESGMTCEMNKREGMHVMERKNVVTLDLRLVILQQIWDKNYNKSI